MIRAGLSGATRIADVSRRAERQCLRGQRRQLSKLDAADVLDVASLGSWEDLGASTYRFNVFRGHIDVTIYMMFLSVFFFKKSFQLQSS